MYQTPSTTKTRVETEGNFCSSATIKNPDDKDLGQVDAHEVNTGFNYEFANEDWDSTTGSN